MAIEGATTPRSSGSRDLSEPDLRRLHGSGGSGRAVIRSTSPTCRRGSAARPTPHIRPYVVITVLPVGVRACSRPFPNFRRGRIRRRMRSRIRGFHWRCRDRVHGEQPHRGAHGPVSHWRRAIGLGRSADLRHARRSTGPTRNPGRNPVAGSAGGVRCRRPCPGHRFRNEQLSVDRLRRRRPHADRTVGVHAVVSPAGLGRARRGDPGTQLDVTRKRSPTPGAGGRSRRDRHTKQETIVVWDRSTGGDPHDRLAGSADERRHRELRQAGPKSTVRVGPASLDPYFSGSSSNGCSTRPGARDRAGRGRTAAGTIDLADLEAHRWTRPRDRRQQRQSGAALGHPRGRLGRGDAEAFDVPGILPGRHLERHSPSRTRAPRRHGAHRGDRGRPAGRCSVNSAPATAW